ncbi:helix-turn-helix transcriptional regulator [Roseateles violae]|uniref:LuxR C-terminal-related transcriptional regulator n=1 Tax=Roseateles violae TaxID=3058042 RepID=A0ABT8DPU6_9BURK|nr:LuxR C-terminal-related transcriptional regulator [Pelomonas sp. PFR6]MDN3918964.1 LuxR C-terminal-related transcriptional regulator [Pelomonas sp. PFR6]
MPGFESLTAPPAPSGRPERRQAASLSSHWLSLVLEELDYGVLLLNAAGRVLHCNLAARRSLDAHHPLQLAGAQLRAADAKDAAQLADALRGAEQDGRRCLLRLGEGAERCSVVVVPLNRDVEQAAVLLVLERRQLCGELAAQWFALRHGLTPTETEVLKALSSGARPTDVAERQGVAISTVRTQIQSIRAKSGADSIGELLRQLAMLPPLMSALRMDFS